MISNYDPIIPRKRFNFFRVISTITVIGILLLVFFMAFYMDSEAYIYIFVIVMLAVSIGAGILESILFQARWQELATINGYELISERKFLMRQTRVKGRHKGKHFELSTFSRGSGRNRRYFTRLLFTIPDGHAIPAFQIVPRSIFHFNRSVTGDPEFDKRFTVKDAPAEILRLIIGHSDRMRQALLELGRHASRPKITFSGSQLEFVENGKVSDPNYLQAVIATLSDLAPLLGRHSQALMQSVIE